MSFASEIYKPLGLCNRRFGERFRCEFRNHTSRYIKHRHMVIRNGVKIFEVRHGNLNGYEWSE